MDFSSIPLALDSLHRRQPSPFANNDSSNTDHDTLKQAVQAAAAQGTSVAADAVAALVPQLLEFDNSTNNANNRWECLAVGLYCATELLTQANDAVSSSSIYMDGPRVPQQENESNANNDASLQRETLQTLCNLLHPVCLAHLEHPEPRVRTLVAKAVGAAVRYAQQQNTANATNTANTENTNTPNTNTKDRDVLQAQLVKSIAEHLKQGRTALEQQQQQQAKAQSDDETPLANRVSQTSAGALDDTTGWRAVETNWQCLATLVRALGPTYLEDYGLPNVEHLEYSSVTHVNRHVRAAAMACLEQLVLAASSASNSSSSSSSSNANWIAPGQPLRTTCLAVLKAGLADNWSQVRMAASVLCRVLLLALSTNDEDDSRNDLYPILLPRMCLNRFYLAQGVKLYSHETWKLVFPEPGQGIAQVVQYLPAVLRYDMKMCDADNHVVREAACQALAELATRMGIPSANAETAAQDPTNMREQLQPHVPAMLQALLMCFHDESWPVRDEACLACGIVCRAYPDECRPELNLLWECWTQQLRDPIWSVREDAAVALADALEAYGTAEFWEPRLLPLIQARLPLAREEQPAMTREEYRAQQNSLQAHTDNQLYSCGSLAPKLGKNKKAASGAGQASKRKEGAGRIGCSNCDVNRDPAPWEATDGVVYLLREMVRVGCAVSDGGDANADNAIRFSDAVLMPLLTELADVCRVRHFPQADDLRTTLWRCLPSMAHDLGKRRFFGIYWELFADLLFRDLHNSNMSEASALSVHAAGQCLQALGELLGPRMFRARLNDDPRAQQAYDRVLEERGNAAGGPAMGAEFSPFGPPGLLDHIYQAPNAAALQHHPSVALRSGGSAAVLE